MIKKNKETTKINKKNLNYESTEETNYFMIQLIINVI